MTFSLSAQQWDRFKSWKETRSSGTIAGAIGGRYTFSFTPNGLGIMATVNDNLDPGSEDLTEYEDW